MSPEEEILYKVTCESIDEELKETYEFIERIESTTNDRFTQKKIREYLIKKNIWK